MFRSPLKFAAAAFLTATLLTTVSSRALAEKEKVPSATSPDKKIEATADDKAILLVDAESGKILVKMAGHTEKVTALAFSPDGKHLASGGDDKSVRMWDVATGKELRRIVTKDAVTSLTYSKDGKTLTAKQGKEKQTWEVATGKEIE